MKKFLHKIIVLNQQERQETQRRHSGRGYRRRSMPTRSGAAQLDRRATAADRLVRHGFATTGREGIRTTL